MKEIKTTDENVTSLDLNLTASQDKALQDAIEHITYWDIYRYKKDYPTYRLVNLTIDQTKYGDIWVSLQTDNGKPGTVGTLFPKTYFFKIGRRGGYSCYNGNQKKVTGNRALNNRSYS